VLLFILPLASPASLTVHGLIYRSISRSLSQIEDGGHGHEKASKRLAALQAMSPCHGEEIRRASAKFYALQRVIKLSDH
jgi:hypothetical protein